jgi:LAGLIDADG endonuclease
MKNNNLKHPFTYLPLYDSGQLIFPDYISGFAQADGSFFCTVSINDDKTGTDAFTFRPTFTLTQDTDSCSVLYKILNYFNCGYINHNRLRDSS